MSQNGLLALQAELRDKPPASLADVAPEDLDHLAGAIRAAHRRQGAELAAAGEQALTHIPRLLRGPIRKLLG